LARSGRGGAGAGDGGGGAVEVEVEVEEERRGDGDDDDDGVVDVEGRASRASSLLLPLPSSGVVCFADAAVKRLLRFWSRTNAREARCKGFCSRIENDGRADCIIFIADRKCWSFLLALPIKERERERAEGEGRADPWSESCGVKRRQRREKPVAKGFD